MKWSIGEIYAAAFFAGIGLTLGNALATWVLDFINLEGEDDDDRRKETSEEDETKT